jgi:YegS/Rv2252/BmrU family lipid kinase
MRVAVVLNSKIKKRKQVYEKLLLLGSTNVATTLSILETEHQGHGIELAKNAAHYHDCILAAGGDGTVNEVVNGIIQSGIPKEKRPILAHYPCGSANDFSRSVFLDDDIEKLIILMRKEVAHPIDIGHATYADEEGQNKERYFANILDCGIGAEVVKRINSSSKPLGVNLAFLQSITSAFLTYQKSTITCITERDSFKEKVLTQIFAIGKYFGNGICIAPDAKPDSGYFQAITVGDISFREYALNLRRLRKGQRVSHPKLTIRKCTEAEVLPHEYSCAVEADGEFLGFAPFQIKMKMHELRLLCEHFPK